METRTEMTSVSRICPPGSRSTQSSEQHGFRRDLFVPPASKSQFLNQLSTGYIPAESGKIPQEPRRKASSTAARRKNPPP
jgi:hypothetical protein